MEKEKSIAVVYLMWLPYGSGKMNDFIRSYLEFKAGVEHRFFIVFKGRSEAGKSEEEKCYQILQENNIIYQPLYFEKGLDMETYKFASQNIECDYLFFLNTSSEIISSCLLFRNCCACLLALLMIACAALSLSI